MQAEKKQSIVLLVAVVLITILVVGGGGYIWKEVTEEQGAQESRNMYEVVLKENVEDDSKSDVYIKNLNDGDEKFFMTVSDVYVNHIHNSEYLNETLYTIRRVGYDGYPDDDWSDELWMYDKDKSGTELYTSRGINFNVSPDSEFVNVSEGGGVM